MKAKINWLLALVIFCIAQYPLWVSAAAPILSLSDSGTGIDRIVTIESTGQFRLAFEAASNWGLSKWYDLVNDPLATTNLTDESQAYHGTVPNYAVESALFQQVFTTLDAKGHMFAAKHLQPNLPRSFTILENTASRITVENTYFPIIASSHIAGLQFTDRYTIYPDGRIFISHKTHVTENQNSFEWRNPTIGLNDPYFDPKLESGAAGVHDPITNIVTDTSKSWTTNQFAGLMYGGLGVETGGGSRWKIVSNTANSLQLGAWIGGNATLQSTSSYTISTTTTSGGWIRATDTQNPYTGTSKIAKYIFAYWNPSTPSPHTNWTKASIMIIPKSDNPYIGKQSTHEWTGYKRWFYVNYGVTLTAGQDITQEYMIQLGTQGSSVLPDLTIQAANPSSVSGSVLEAIANAYLADPLPPGGNLAPDTQNPTVPTGLTAVGASSTKINLSWTVSTDNIGVAGYRIYRDGTLIATQSGTTYSDTVLTAATTYSYTVQAYDFEGNTSAQSSAITAQPISIPSVTVSTKAYGILSYGSHDSDTMNWITNRFSWMIGGASAPGSGVKWTTYFDIYGPGSIAELLSMKEWAALNSVLYEDMLLHAKVDYTSAIPVAWSQMDKFDNFEGAKGVMRTVDELSYTDLTATAYSGLVTWQNTMYVGYEEPFDQINLVFSTAGSGITRAWEYWNGSTWAALTTSGTASGLTATGQVAFTPPSNWARKVINNSRNKYFVRCRITAATISPVTSSIKGDNWLRGANNLARGWDPTSSTIINTGELRYNPIPPAGSAAKFPYQARISYYGSNHFIANPADFQSIGGTSSRTWAKYSAYAINALVAAGGQTGVMCDDGERNVSSDGIASTSTDFVDKTSETWTVSSAAKYHDITVYSNALNAASVGINSQTKSDVLLGNFNLAEYYSEVTKTGSSGAIAYSSGATTMSYDDYLPARNPNGVVGIMIYNDSLSAPQNQPALAWDRSNRGPLVALSKHLIAKNDNTIMSYYTQGGYVYGNTDEVIMTDGSTWHQATQGVPPLADVKRWGTWFPAMGVDIGIPDTAGYNSGLRNLAWKVAGPPDNIGDVMPVYRRDYTKAIVLHRPASYSSTAAHYSNYSTLMDLGGTYYPLSADGTTGTAVTSISLRTGEGAILMKTPITGTPSVPIPPPVATQPATPRNLMLVK